MKLTLVVPFLNQFELTQQAAKYLLENKELPDTEIIFFDNGSNSDIFKTSLLPPEVKYLFVRENIGNYPVFELLTQLSGDIVGILHNDTFVYEKGYDRRIVEAFETNQKLGLVGFIGSNEIDSNGGRGGGTMSNFMGNTTSYIKNGVNMAWVGSAAEVHGKRVTDLHKAAVVDGCAMIFKKEALINIGFKRYFPLHHFYDRLMSCQILEKGWEIAVLGIAFDHISGQTANQEQLYHDLAHKWCLEHAIDAADGNWDLALYLEAERQFLSEFRDQKHLIPIIV